MIDSNFGTKLFYGIFFLLILASIALTYYTIVIKQDYVVFSEEDELPEPYDFYKDLIIKNI